MSRHGAKGSPWPPKMASTCPKLSGSFPPLGLNNLALACELCGRLDEAGDLYEESVEVLEQLGDEAHPYVAISLGNKAGTLLARGEIDEAIVVMRRAFEAQLRAFGERHPETATARHNLGYLVTAEVYVSRLLNREEFIAHCNRYKTQEAILDKLE